MLEFIIAMGEDAGEMCFFYLSDFKGFMQKLYLMGKSTFAFIYDNI